MKNMEAHLGMLQAEYLLEYDRRKIQDCVDVFRNLATVYWQMDSEEFFPEEVKQNVEDSVETAFPDEIVSGEEEYCNRVQCLEDERARENRKSIAAQMRQIASLMQDVASKSVQMIRLGARQERQIVRAMAGEGLVISDIFLIREKEGILEVKATVSTKKERTVTVQEIAGYLSVLLDLRLTVQKRNPFFVGTEPVNLYFQEEPFFSCMTGAAVAIREGERISGDSFSFSEQDNHITILLSDGVGSGETASADSGQVVELAEQILEAGLSGYMTVQMMNSLMRTQAQEEHMSTLDLCRVDLQKGTASFVKAGGVCSFIRHRDSVERVGENSLPLGFEEEMQIRECIKFLEDGDFIILLSDGIIQEWSSDDCLMDIQRQIGLISSKSPQDMANRILRYAIERSRGKIRDDMTVLVLGIWEKGDAEKRM